MLLVKLPVISPPNWAADVTFVNVLLLGIAITIYHVPDGMDIVESDCAFDNALMLSFVATVAFPSPSTVV